MTMLQWRSSGTCRPGRILVLPPIPNFPPHTVSQNFPKCVQIDPFVVIFKPFGHQLMFFYSSFPNFLMVFSCSSLFFLCPKKFSQYIFLHQNFKCRSNFAAPPLKVPPGTVRPHCPPCYVTAMLPLSKCSSLLIYIVNIFS